jgi:hypothetical protein
MSVVLIVVRLYQGRGSDSMVVGMVFDLPIYVMTVLYFAKRWRFMPW